VIDRLHVLDGGKIVELIDFKTDRVESMQELQSRYAGQMDAYAAIAKAIYPDAQVKCLLVSTALGGVV
jgi:ATP-dependent exoDNAse (exonuclease V) beta subunit